MGSLAALLSILVLSATPGHRVSTRAPDAVEVFHCGFEPSSDEDYDAWPDHWTRRRGPNLPSYLPVEIREEPSPEGKHCLRMSLNGGGIALVSPPIEIGAIFSYELEGYVKTEGLEHDVAYIAIVFLDAQGQRVGSQDSERFTTASQWTKVRLGPIAAPSEKVQSAVIELRVEPQERADLRGTIWFDDLWLGRLPRISLSTNSTCNIFSADSPAPEVTCQVSGILERDPLMVFELLDCSSQSVSLQRHRLEGQVLRRNRRKHRRSWAPRSRRMSVSPARLAGARPLRSRVSIECASR